MRLGLVVPNMGPLSGPDSLAVIGRRAEELGFDMLWVGERTLYPLDPKASYPAGGPLPEVFKTNLDPLDTLGFIAAQTSRIGLGTAVINLPWYSPVLLARRLTTLDVLSHGRLRVGIGLGWSPDEYEAAGVPFERRMTRGMEALQVLKTIWTDDPVEFEGEFYRVPRSHIGPKPAQKPHPPVYVGAFGPRALAWAGQEAEGWIGGGVPFEFLEQMFTSVKNGAQAAGRDPGTIEFIVAASIDHADRPCNRSGPFTGAPDQIAADIATTRELGAAELMFNLVAVNESVPSVDSLLAQMEVLHALHQSTQEVE